MKHTRNIDYLLSNEKFQTYLFIECQHVFRQADTNDILRSFYAVFCTVNDWLCTFTFTLIYDKRVGRSCKNVLHPR